MSFGKKKKYLVVPGFFDAPSSSPERALSDVDSGHLLQSLRVRVADYIAISDGAGRCCDTHVVRVENRRVFVSIDEGTEREVAEHLPCVTLYIALAKPKIFSLAVQKATELGIKRIIPIITDRCNEKAVRKLVSEDSMEALSRLARWQEIARQAARQSENPWLPEIFIPSLFESALGGFQGDAQYAHLVADPTGISWDSYIASSDRNTPSKKAQNFSIWIGPEGGFSESELSAMRTRAISIVCIHRNVLRVETAVIVATTLVSLRNGTLFDR